MGQVYDSGQFEKVLSQGLALSDWSGFAAREAASKKRGKLRGLGIATFLEWTGANVLEERVLHHGHGVRRDRALRHHRGDGPGHRDELRPARGRCVRRAARQDPRRAGRQRSRHRFRQRRLALAVHTAGSAFKVAADQDGRPPPRIWRPTRSRSRAPISNIATARSKSPAPTRASACSSWPAASPTSASSSTRRPRSAARPGPMAAMSARSRSIPTPARSRSSPTLSVNDVGPRRQPHDRRRPGPGRRAPRVSARRCASMSSTTPSRASR